MNLQEGSDDSFEKLYQLIKGKLPQEEARASMDKVAESDGEEQNTNTSYQVGLQILVCAHR